MFENDKLYRESYNDKLSYIDISEAIDDKIYIKNYILHIIKNEVE